jgi:hypothetical protein
LQHLQACDGKLEVELQLGGVVLGRKHRSLWELDV